MRRVAIVAGFLLMCFAVVTFAADAPAAVSPVEQVRESFLKVPKKTRRLNAVYARCVTRTMGAASTLSDPWQAFVYATFPGGGELLMEWVLDRDGLPLGAWTTSLRLSEQQLFASDRCIHVAASVFDPKPEPAPRRRP